MSTTEPRQLWIYHRADGRSDVYDQPTNLNDFGAASEALHVIEMSAYKEIEDKYNSAKFAAEKLSERLAEMNLYLQGADLQNKFTSPMLQACNKQIKSLEAKMEMAKVEFTKYFNSTSHLSEIPFRVLAKASEAIAKLEGKSEIQS